MPLSSCPQVVEFNQKHRSCSFTPPSMESTEDCHIYTVFLDSLSNTRNKTYSKRLGDWSASPAPESASTVLAGSRQVSLLPQRRWPASPYRTVEPGRELGPFPQEQKPKDLVHLPRTGNLQGLPGSCCSPLHTEWPRSGIFRSFTEVDTPCKGGSSCPASNRPMSPSGNTGLPSLPLGKAQVRSPSMHTSHQQKVLSKQLVIQKKTLRLTSKSTPCPSLGLSKSIK